MPAAAGTARLVDLATGAETTPMNARFVARPLPVVLHIAAAIPYSIVGAFQFVPVLRRRARGWHRRVGALLAPLGLVAALTGVWMAHFYPWPEGDGVTLYRLRLVFGVGMVVAIGLGLHALRRRDFVSHGAWMMRGYAIGLGAGTQVLTHAPWILLGLVPSVSHRALAMGAGWVINVAVAEMVIRRA